MDLSPALGLAIEAARAAVALLQQSRDSVAKAKAELALIRIETLQEAAAALELERDRLKQQVAEQEQELTDLRERLAVHELSTAFEERHSLLYKRGTNEGPFCLACRTRLIPLMPNVWSCPKCKTPMTGR